MIKRQALLVAKLNSMIALLIESQKSVRCLAGRFKEMMLENARAQHFMRDKATVLRLVSPTFYDSPRSEKNIKRTSHPTLGKTQF